jgi:hypothetical protein
VAQPGPQIGGAAPVPAGRSADAWSTAYNVAASQAGPAVVVAPGSGFGGVVNAEVVDGAVGTGWVTTGWVVVVPAADVLVPDAEAAVELDDDDVEAAVVVEPEPSSELQPAAATARRATSRAAGAARVTAPSPGICSGRRSPV